MIRLRRITSSVAYIPEIDGIRFIAIALVVAYHLAGDVLRHSPAGYAHSLASNPIFWVAQRGIFGIQMFFVVSGFVLALPFARAYLADAAMPELARYYKRRLTRLEPPYVAALIVFFGLKMAGGRGSFIAMLPHLLASIVYQHNLIYGAPSTIEFVAWTLEIEVQFYLLAPLISWMAFRTRDRAARRMAIAGAILACAIAARYLFPVSVRCQLSLICYAQYFLAGFLLADLYVPGTKEAGGGFGWDLAAVAGLAAPFACMYANLPLDYLAPFLLFAAYHSVFRSIAVRAALSNPFIATIGGMCYSIYLVHNYVIAFCGMFTERIGAAAPFATRFMIQSAMMVPIVLAASTVFFVMIERPCMLPDWPARLAAALRNRGRVDPMAAPGVVTSVRSE